MRARTLLVILAALAADAGAARAQDADACTRFDWPLAREQGWFSADLPRLPSGGELPADRPAAQLVLRPSAEAALPQAPSRALRPGTYAGYLRVPAQAAPGLVQVTLSGEGWIDLAEGDGAPGRPAALTGQRGCPSVRKSARYRVGTRPLVVSVSDSSAETVRIAVAPVAP